MSAQLEKKLLVVGMPCGVGNGAEQGSSAPCRQPTSSSGRSQRAAGDTPKPQSSLQRLLNAGRCFKIRREIFKSRLAHSHQKAGS